MLRTSLSISRYVIFGFTTLPSVSQHYHRFHNIVIGFTTGCHRFHNIVIGGHRWSPCYKKLSKRLGLVLRQCNHSKGLFNIEKKLATVDPFSGDGRSEPKRYWRIPRSSFACSECGKAKGWQQFESSKTNTQTPSKKNRPVFRTKTLEGLHSQETMTWFRRSVFAAKICFLPCANARSQPKRGPVTNPAGCLC